MARKPIGNNKNLNMRPNINVGCTIDIPTSSILTGKNGESIINGGLSSIEGIAGLGNNFKSTILHYLTLTAMDRMEATIPDKVTLHTYDTENNMSLNLDRYNHLGNEICEYLPKDLINNNIWTITTKSESPGMVWVKDFLYKHINEKENDKDALVVYTAFMNKITKEPLKLPYPSFIEIDSLSELEDDSTMDTLEVKELSKTNTLFMQQGLFKSKVMKDLPRLSNKANVYISLTVHLGKKIDMSTGPFSPKPVKELQYSKQDEKFKGATDKLNFLTTHLWKAFGASSFINQTTKEPEFPSHKQDVNTDLNIVKTLQYRSKTGHSGYTLELVVSQNDGVLPELTEFKYLKDNKYGIGGNVRSYFLELVPDISLSRTTVRNKLKENKQLARACNILTEIHQLSIYKPQYRPLICTGQELYDDLIALGYDWDILLNTRGWWSIDQYNTDVIPFLSSVDLLKMRKELYIPFWMDKDKKIKKEWQHHFNKKNDK